MDSAKLIRQAATHQRAGRVQEAEQLLEKVLRYEPANETAVRSLLQLWSGSRRFDRAVQHIQRAIETQPQNASFHMYLAGLLQQAGQFAQAERQLLEAARLQPKNPMPFIALGQLLADQRRLPEAEQAFARALQIQPGNSLPWIALSAAVTRQGRFAHALQLAQRAAQVAPGSVQAHQALADALHTLGQADRAHASYARCWQLGTSAVAASALLHNSNFMLELTPEQIFNAHRTWGERFADPVAAKFEHSNARDPQRRLRIGYVSANFRGHAISYFIEPLLNAHDRANVEIFGYSAVLSPDAITQRLATTADQWRDISRLPDQQAAEQIHADAIDVLVDLTGHTEQHRLGVFVLRPAPVQVTYLGYPNTTGMTAIGYRLTDAHADPPDASEQYYSEQLVRLPRSALCYRAPDGAPEIQPLPAQRQQGITFGSFNRIAKFSPRTLELWSQTLQAVPQSRLMLKAAGLNEPATQQYVRDMLTRVGIGADRLVLLGPDISPAAHYARYHDVDIALDCYPYHGTTTTCEAMWMGVPSIVLAGQTHVSRVGVSLAHNVGLDDFVANSNEEFVEIAKRAASDLDRLAEIRRTLRDRLQQSPLMDEKGFCRELEEAYRSMWRRWCEQQP